MLLDKYLPRTQFSSYEDFKTNYRVIEPDDFNFGFDIVDGWAKEEPDKRALVWCDDHGGEKTFTFTDISRLSNKVANYLKSLGLKKGDRMMLILRRRWEYWICAPALHKLGVILIPATLQLTKKDIVYRANSAEIKGVICVDDKYVLDQVDASLAEAPGILHRLVVGDGAREGWTNLDAAIEPFSDEFPRPTGAEATRADDTMLIYFTSGTTSMPKLVAHSFKYPLGHITTAKYWQQVEENKLHMSVSDSGWAKFGWGKIYGQWICGATIFAYDMDKFIADVKAVCEKNENKCLVAVSEGIKFADGGYVGEFKASKTDLFGHAQLGGVGSILANQIKEKLGIKTRAIELNLMQRCASHLASATDVEEAFEAGRHAVLAAVSGQTDFMVAYERKPGDKYEIEYKLVPLSICANTEKKIPQEWITNNGTGISKDFVDYALPLIQGEWETPKVDGLPRFAQLKKVLVK